MRRTKLIGARSAMAAMLTLSAGPAMAEEGDFGSFDNDAVEEVEFEDGAFEIEFADGSDLDLEGLEGDFLEFSEVDGFDSDFDSDVDTDSSNSVAIA